MKAPESKSAGPGFGWIPSGMAFGLILSACVPGAGLVIPGSPFSRQMPPSREDAEQERIYLHYLERICSRAASTHRDGRDRACRERSAERTSP